MTKIEAINKALKMIWNWQDAYEFCLKLPDSYPEIKKEYDESIETVMCLEEIKTFLETG
jgi:hypothetical protein